MTLLKSVAGSLVISAVCVAISLLLPDSRPVAYLVVAVSAALIATSFIFAIKRGARSTMLFVLSTLIVVIVVTVALTSFFPTEVVGRVPEQKMSADTRGDCAGCSAGRDVVGVGLRQVGLNRYINIQMAAPPTTGDELTIWFANRAGAPFRMLRGSEEWLRVSTIPLQHSVSGIAITQEASRVIVSFSDSGSYGPVAVTTAGDRAPDIGYFALERGATVKEELPQGDVAAKTAERIAEVQTRIWVLSEPQRRLAESLIARQQTRGTFTYEGTGNPGIARVIVTVGDGAERQDFFAAGDQLRSVILKLPDRDLRCTPVDATISCSPDPSAAEPASQALVMIESPDKVSVGFSDVRTTGLGRALCVVIATSVPGGPFPGERCALEDGTLAYSRNDASGVTLTITKIDGSVDQTRLRPPA